MPDNYRELHQAVWRECWRVLGPDGIFVLNNLFSGGPAPTCEDTADANDDGTVNITDAVFILNFLFSGGPPAPPPGTVECGLDETGDDVECAVYESC